MKNAAEAQRKLVEAYGESPPSDKSYRQLFCLNKSGDFSVENKEHLGGTRRIRCTMNCYNLAKLIIGKNIRKI